MNKNLASFLKLFIAAFQIYLLSFFVALFRLTHIFKVFITT